MNDSHRISDGNGLGAPAPTPPITSTLRSSQIGVGLNLPAQTHSFFHSLGSNSREPGPATENRLFPLAEHPDAYHQQLGTICTYRSQGCFCDQCSLPEGQATRQDPLETPGPSSYPNGIPYYPLSQGGPYPPLDAGENGPPILRVDGSRYQQLPDSQDSHRSSNVDALVGFQRPQSCSSSD